MNNLFFLAIFAVGLPLTFGNYVNTPYNGDSLKNIEEHSDSLPSSVEKNLEDIDTNSAYSNYQNNEFIANKLIESTLANKVRNGNIDVVPPNVIDQSSYRSLLVPSGHNTQVISNNPLPPVVVHQAPTAPITVNSGPAAVIRSSPVIYKITPSIIYQHEVINKIPTPVHVHPIYLKVFKAGKTVDVPINPIVSKYAAPLYNSAPAYSSHNLRNSYENTYFTSSVPDKAVYQPSLSNY